MTISSGNGESGNIFVKFDESVARKCYELMLYRTEWRCLLKVFEYLFHGLLWFVAVGFMYYFGTKFVKANAIVLFQALVLDIVLIGLIKVCVRRKRPRLNRTHDMVIMTNSGVDKFSFPSGHSSRAIMTANLLVFLFESALVGSRSFALVAIALNLVSYTTCLSRLLLLRHYFTDVLAGIVVGYLTFFFVILFLV